MIINYSLTLLADISRKNDIYGLAAHNLCHKCHDLESFTIEEIAKACNVSASTVSRLATKMNCRNFSTLANCVSIMSANTMGEGQLLQAESKNAESVLTSLNLRFNEMTASLSQAISSDALKDTALLMLQGHRVFIIGSPVPQAALLLQMELEAAGIEAICHFYPEDQSDDIKEMKADDIAVIFEASTT